MPVALSQSLGAANLSSRTSFSIEPPSHSNQPITAIPRLKDVELLHTRAILLQQPTQINIAHFVVSQSEPSSTEPNVENEEEEEIIVEGEAAPPARSAPVHTIEADDIRKQGSSTAAEVLRGLPGFAINDVGFGADTHTGTFYRGASINQSVFLINGRPFGSNVNTYHGATDLNSIPVGAIEQIQLSSGTAATLYGSEAFGGVVDITTKEGGGPFKANGLTQFGSFSQSNLLGQFNGSVGNLNYAFNYQRFKTDNDYRVPVGAANRGADGRLFNGDSTVDNYYGRLGLDLNSRNSLSLDVSTITSRRGLLYFGFPLQRDRLDHDALNVGLSWKAQVGAGTDSVLRTTLGFNRDYFNTYGPTQQVFYRTGTLDSQALTARVDHDWQVTSNYNLRWGVDVKNSFLNGEVLSTTPSLARLNETEDRDRFQTALFALNTIRITNTVQAEFGLRQNFTSEFGNYLNPSVGARWNASPVVAFRGSWVAVQRDPGLDQLYLFDTVHNWLPNPNLQPETGSSWTAGVDLRLSPSVAAQLTYFGSRLDDRLGVQAGRWQNIGLVTTNGLEAALRWKIAPQWNTFLNYTYTNAEIQTGPERGLQLGLVPFSVAQFGIGYDSNGWQINLYANYFSGARRAFFTNPGDLTTDFSPSWVRLDLGLRVPIVRGLGVVVFLENLADQTFEKANRIYQPGLTFRVGLQSY
ncbi:TonB-dependent receptor [Leptolyngbya sp. FACHB-36]|nr:TonB-dependent receptor [Leptolyngbya sp. FACHB-36]